MGAEGQGFLLSRAITPLIIQRIDNRFLERKRRLAKLPSVFAGLR